MAERILKELQSTVGNNQSEALELRLLASRLSLAGRKKPVAEATLRSLLQLAGESGFVEDVGVAVTLATAYVAISKFFGSLYSTRCMCPDLHMVK